MDYRGFVFAFHATHGLLILRAYKPKKGSHWQLPGGHVDAPEIEKLGLDKAFLAGAKRELFEETGLQLPAERFVPVYVTKAEGDGLECFELKARRYFLIELYDEDSLEFGKSQTTAPVPTGASFPHRICIHGCSSAGFDFHNILRTGDEVDGLSRSCRADDGIPFLLRLSNEHTGFTFERDLERAAELISLHSGGKNTKALKRVSAEGLIKLRM